VVGEVVAVVVLVVVAAVVVVGRVVVVVLGGRVVLGAVLAGVVGGGAVEIGAASAVVGGRLVEVVPWRMLVSGAAVAEAGAAAWTVVGGHGRPPHGGGLGLPKAWRARITRIAMAATEVAALAVLAAFIIGVFVYRELPTKQTVRVLKDSAGQTAVVMLIVAASAVLGWYLTSEQIPQKFARLILETTSNKYLILLFLNIFFFIAGMFLHSAAAIILIVPIVMPLIRQIGVDPIHFGIIVTINLGVGQQTPPVATVLFTTAAIARLPFWEVFKAGWPFTVVLALVTLLVTYVPWISLGLLNLVNW